ncbi:hypothetical protein F4604DRAFT_1677445 [Suillus subluteus]|nr:hypothetical protein F4604DRAFT_1677445 [Suillus subluteus]
MPQLSSLDLRSLQLTTHISLVRCKGDPPEELVLAFQWMSGERNGRRVEQTITRLSLRYLKGLIDETKATLDFVNGWWFKYYNGAKLPDTILNSFALSRAMFLKIQWIMNAHTSELSAPSTDSFAVDFSFEPYMVAEDSNSSESERDLSIAAADSGSTAASNHDSTIQQPPTMTALAKLELKMDENLSCLAALGETNAIFVDRITEIAKETKEAAQKAAEEAKEAAKEAKEAKEANNVEVWSQIQEVKVQIQEVKDQIDAGKSILGRIKDILQGIWHS